MALDPHYREAVLQELSRIGPVEIRPMFGGAGVYLNGVIFGLIAHNALYFKVDDVNRPDYVEAGADPFVPFPDKPFPMSYYEVPDWVRDDPNALATWAARALEASRRAPKETKKRRSTKRGF